MDFRQAVMEDLPQLKDMYKQIIQNMNKQKIQIWAIFIHVNFLRKI